MTLASTEHKSIKKYKLLYEFPGYIRILPDYNDSPRPWEKSTTTSHNPSSPTGECQTTREKCKAVILVVGWNDCSTEVDVYVQQNEAVVGSSSSESLLYVTLCTYRLNWARRTS